MNEIKAPSLQSLLESDIGSTDSLLAELDLENLDDVEYSIPPSGDLPTLESVLNEFDADSDIASEFGLPTPSIAEDGSVRGGGTGGGGSIMRYALLAGVSAQIASAADRVNAGLASACAVSAFIAVGTTHGHILNFDVTQTLRWAHQDKHGQGAVSALAYNGPECTRLLAGFARGLVVMIDTHSGDVLRQLFDVITPNTGLLHVKWTSRAALALCADSGGSVWSLNFTRKLGIRGCSSRCLFSGARGEVCAVEPLHTAGHEPHELDQYCIVALATLSKYFIVTIRPRLKVIKYARLQGPADCLPLLAWQMVLIQAADTTRSIDPVIVVGRGNELFFHQLFMSSGRISLLYLRHVQMQTNLLSAHWLGPKCVGCLDTSEILHLIDVRSSKELECIDMANAGLVYGSAQFKGLATGGNVSPALALAGTVACYSSIAIRGTQLYVLGARSLHMIGVRTWTERISYLVKNQRWQEACDLALEGYHAANERPKRKTLAKERIIILFKEYLAARAPDYCLSAIVKCLIEVGELDMLWTQLWDRLHTKGPFLQYISDHIENEHIRRVNPAISQALVEYWLQISPSKLEELILKLDWTCLDLHQVLSAARRYKLFRAQIHLNTLALDDYTLAITELVPLVLKEHSDLGNNLLVYISSAFAGRYYPSIGDIPKDKVQIVKHEVLRCLTSSHSNTSEEEELPYPYLRALLKFDTRETLNVISLAFQEPEFAGELGFSQRKRIVNILLEIMTPENATWAEIGCLLNFIAQQISQQCLPRDTQLLEHVLNYLAKEEIANESQRQHAERESAWHELLLNNCLEYISNDEEQLKLAQQARCYSVQEYLLEKMQRYDKILDCYLNNNQRHETMFTYVERYAIVPEREIYPQVLYHLKHMLRINAEETARIVAFHFSIHLDELLDAASSDENLLFLFLQHLHKGGTILTPVQSEQLLELLCKRTPEAVEDYLAEPNAVYDIKNAIEVVNKYKHTAAAIFLYEKNQNYRKAFDLSMKLLVESNHSEAAQRAQQVANLCARSSQAVQAHERQSLWFELLQTILPREELKSITKNMLHAASQHVDLPNLVQLVLNTRNVSGNLGDIKDLLLSMLTESRRETKAMETALKILGTDLHKQFVARRQDACRGHWVPVVRCVICHNRLFNQSSVLVLGTCEHVMHDECAHQLQSGLNGLGDAFNEDEFALSPFKCPRCNIEMPTDFTRPTQLAQPSHNGIKNASNRPPPAERLPLKAPPRRF